MRTYLALTGLLLSIALTCSREKESLFKDRAITITEGTACGWCAGSDSVILSEDQLLYRFMNPCNHNAYSKVTHMDRAAWESLISKLDMDKFEAIDINTCYVCVDGCDTWITIKNGSDSHTIRFGIQDSLAIENIRPFVEQLDSIRTDQRSLKN
jgi:hypothetical protein